MGYIVVTRMIHHVGVELMQDWTLLVLSKTDWVRVIISNGKRGLVTCTSDETSQQQLARLNMTLISCTI